MRTLILFGLAQMVWAVGPFDNLSSTDLERGKKLFQAQCSVCHGIDGSGGRGANLAVAKFKNAANDAALLEVIRNGIPETEMPAAWQMSDRESLQVGYYVRSLGSVASNIRVAGDIPAGKEVFFGKGGCSNCHILDGSGNAMGPDLTGIGARRSPAHLREAILEPEKSVPEGFLLVRVATVEGKEIRGIRVNEDTFTIQIRDLAGRVHSFRKSEVKSIRKEFGQTPMPANQGRLRETEVDNLVAYLASLRGEK